MDPNYTDFSSQLGLFLVLGGILLAAGLILYYTGALDEILNYDSQPQTKFLDKDGWLNLTAKRRAKFEKNKKKSVAQMWMKNNLKFWTSAESDK